MLFLCKYNLDLRFVKELTAGQNSKGWTTEVSLSVVLSLEEIEFTVMCLVGKYIIKTTSEGILLSISELND